MTYRWSSQYSEPYIPPPVNELICIEEISGKMTFDIVSKDQALRLAARYPYLFDILVRHNYAEGSWVIVLGSTKELTLETLRWKPVQINEKWVYVPR